MNPVPHEQLNSNNEVLNIARQKISNFWAQSASGLQSLDEYKRSILYPDEASYSSAGLREEYSDFNFIRRKT